MQDMGKEYLDMLFQAGQGLGIELSFFEFNLLLMNSLVLGLILTFLTYMLNAPLLPSDPSKAKKKIKLKMDAFLASTNILFLCVGLTGVMVLVNNNLARALAIGATLGLVRFRVSLGTKLIGSNMLFGIIAGIACGLGELTVAWSITIVYVILQSVLYVVIRRYQVQAEGIDALELLSSSDDDDEPKLPKHPKKKKHVPVEQPILQ